MKKTYNSENVGKKKSFVNNGTIFFFEIRNYSINVFEITSVRVLLNKEGLLKLASNKSVKTACICIVVFFFIISNIMVKTFFQEERCFI